MQKRATRCPFFQKDLGYNVTLTLLHFSLFQTGEIKDAGEKASTSFSGSHTDSSVFMAIESHTDSSVFMAVQRHEADPELVIVKMDVPSISTLGRLCVSEHHPC